MHLGDFSRRVPPTAAQLHLRTGDQRLCQFAPFGEFRLAPSARLETVELADRLRWDLIAE